MLLTARQLRQLIREAAIGERVPDEHRWPDDARAQLWDIIKAVEAGQLDHPAAESQVLQIIEPIEGGPLPPSIYSGPKGIQRLRVHLEEQEIPGVEVEAAAEAVLDADGALTTSTLFDFLRAQGHQDHLISRAVDLATRARFSWVPDEWRSTGALNEMFGGQRSNPPRGGYGPLTLPRRKLRDGQPAAEIDEQYRGYRGSRDDTDLSPGHSAYGSYHLRQVTTAIEGALRDIGRHPGAWSAGDIGKVQTWAQKRDPDGKRVFNLKRDLVAEWRRMPKHWPPHMLASALS